MDYRGSEWHKWDLHLHSNASDGKGTCEEILKKAAEAGLSVIALTDHHTAKNIDKAKEIGDSLGIKVISGIEFRTEYGQKSVHMIGLFPDFNGNIKLDSKALGDLVLNPLGLSDTLIIAKAKEKKPELTDDAAFKEGMFLVQVDFKTAADLIHSLGGIVTVHAGDKANGIEEEMKHQGKSPRNTKHLYESLGVLKEELMKDGYIDICEISKEDDSEEFYLTAFGKPSIVCSDAHDLNDIGLKFTWIKADKTFDGLRQILFEPQDRVNLGQTPPEQKSDYLVIDRIEINHPDFGSQIIRLNQNLNSIIGGRSSGKSILLGGIAKSIDPDIEAKPGNVSYNEYINTNILPGMQVYWRDGIIGVSRKIDYFSQSYINGLAADSKEIASLVRGILSESPDKKKLIEDLKGDITLNKGEIINLVTEYFVHIDKLRELEAEVLTIGAKEGIHRQIELFEKSLEDIKSKMGESLTEQEESNFKIQQNEIERCNSLLGAANNTVKILKGVQQLVGLTPIPSAIRSLPGEILDQVQKFYDDLTEEISSRWGFIIGELASRKEDEAKEIKSNIDKILQDANFVKCTRYFSGNSHYVRALESLNAEKAKLSRVLAIEASITSCKENNDGIRAKILKRHIEFHDLCLASASGLNYTISDVSISSRLAFSTLRFNQTVTEKFFMRGSEIQGIANHAYSGIENYGETIKSLFDKTVRGEFNLKGGTTKQQAISDLMSTNYFMVKHEVTYDGDPLSAMSEGKKAFIILRMLLDFNSGDHPIIIDQPEDDLDNRAIYEDLVRYLKNIKSRRQVILASHNPNIVVGGDSELVICANQNGVGSPNRGGVKFQYIYGSLENTAKKKASDSILSSQGIREHVCEILEGGNEAFLKRERKYQIKAMPN